MNESRYDDEAWTHQEFLEKMDSEGGVIEMLRWGGTGLFSSGGSWRRYDH